MTLQFIHDNRGNTTGVFIPIEEWQDLKEKYTDLQLEEAKNYIANYPFADGNGRLSRLLMNYIQHYHGLPLSVVYQENKQDYYTALEKFFVLKNCPLNFS